MNKRLLISLLALTLSFQIVGCTSGDSAQDQEESVVSDDENFNEENSGDFEEGGDAQASNDEGDTEGGEESVDDTALTDEAAPEGEATETADAEATEGDPAPEGDELALDEGDAANEFPDEVAGTEGAEAGDQAATEQQPTDQGLFEQQPATDQAAAEPPPASTDTAAAATDTAASDTASADTAATDTGSTDVAASEPAPAKPYLPLLKIKDAPFEQGGTLLNRYYVAREGDTAKGVSEKIYGSNRSKDLKNWNPVLKNRPMKVGDKIYYNSPKDPADSARMISWYEEQGLSPQVYTTQEGEDIRELSKKLIGNKDSWKELWATNMDVESKGTLPAGTELRYYPAGSADTAVAAAPPSDQAPQAGGAPNDFGLPPDDPTLNPQPPQDVAMNQAPPPDMNAAGQVAPPPPPDAGMAPPPPPPPDTAAVAPPPPPADAAPETKPTVREAAADEDGAGEQDQTMMLGAAGMLLLGAVFAISVVRRKRASKRIDMTQTQI